MSKPILFHIPFYSSSPAVVAVHELGLADTIEVRNSSDGQHKVGEIGANNPHGFVRQHVNMVVYLLCYAF